MLKPKPKPVEKKVEKPEPKPEKKPDPKPEKKPDPKPQPKPEPKPEPKPAPKPEKKAEPAPKRTLADILKDVRKTESTQEPVPDQSKEKPAKEAASEPTATRLSDRLSMSELDALKRQIAQCWNPPVGSKDADFVVYLNIQVNPDRTVRSAEIANRNEIGNDISKRTVAESALRAVRNPACSPLKLPENKYDLWNTVVMTFNMREMLGL